ncbi:hypothetical protein [Phreatobacter sp. AB_2022a]|uniref:hypothetical protein n=1 Tax=Phreatobacter sp. AB_2022a TaxID=3003134 RepID=UPI00228717A6|nr:hypothetical protein [Phreatobacter sp. AB_2022a]MCZ0734992.1 hypothetical protein [Phreatobacter sp. AB_2022a]
MLVFALAAKRDCADPAFLPWAARALRKHARFVARASGRRRRRERAPLALAVPGPDEPPRFPAAFPTSPPRSRRVVSRLIDSGMGRREIGHPWRGSAGPAPGGQKRAWQRFAGDRDPPLSMPAVPLDGHTRRALKVGLRPARSRAFAIRDPDGLPFFRTDSHRPGGHGN